MMLRNISLGLGCLSLVLCFGTDARAQGVVYLSDLKEQRCENVHGGLGKDHPYWTKLFSIGTRSFAKGIVTHPPAQNGQRALVEYALNGEYVRFIATLGTCTGGGNTMNYTISTDKGPVLSGPFPKPPAVVEISIPLEGALFLRLEVDNGGNGNENDHAAWGGARLVKAEAPRRGYAAKPPTPAVTPREGPRDPLALFRELLTRVSAGRLAEALALGDATLQEELGAEGMELLRQSLATVLPAKAGSPQIIEVDGTTYVTCTLTGRQGSLLHVSCGIRDGSVSSVDAKRGR